MAAAALPAFAFGQSEPTASIVVTDSGFRDANSTDPTDNSVQIAPGESVQFSYPSGSGRHNVVFDGRQPTSCTQTAGEQWAPNPPLPFYAQGPGWAGHCTFATAGTYRFRSQGDTTFRGTVVVAAPTPTPTPTATPAHVRAFDNFFRDMSSTASDNSVTIAPGGRVTFDYPAGSGTQTHNVNFNGANKPSSCTQTKSTPGSFPVPVPPLPGYAQGPGWEGYCDFPAAGTYSFVCQAHPDMTGSVIVEQAGEPTPTPTPTPTATPTPTPTQTPPPVEDAASIEAKDATSPTRNWFQDASQDDPADSSVEIEPGETVTFSFREGTSAHNVDFGQIASPPVCEQTASLVVGPVPPLPRAALPKGWAGQCTFAQAGLYQFVCSAHPEMKGSVSVAESGEEPPPVPTVEPDEPDEPAATPTPRATVAPPAPAPVLRDGNPAAVPGTWASIDKPVSGLTVARLARGKLRLIARCVSAGSGTLTLTVSKAQARRLKLKGTRLAVAKATCDGNGRFTVTVKPMAAARRALKGYRRAVKVTATLRIAGVKGRTTDRRSLTLAGKENAR